jgi:hypothetical protein
MGSIPVTKKLGRLMYRNTDLRAVNGHMVKGGCEVGDPGPGQTLGEGGGLDGIPPQSPTVESSGGGQLQETSPPLLEPTSTFVRQPS